MTARQVVSSRFPYVPVKITVRGRSVNVEALLDTGFDGDVIAPRHLITDSAPPDYSESWVLADGSYGGAPAYFGTVEVGPFGPFDVTILVLGREVLVGRGITNRFAVTFDHGRRVIVEP